MTYTDAPKTPAIGVPVDRTVGPVAEACPTCGSDCNERDEIFKAEREIERLQRKIESLRMYAEDNKRAADIFAAALQLVREHPEFDNAPDGTRHLFAAVIDAALRQEIHPALAMVVALSATSEPVT